MTNKQAKVYKSIHRYKNLALILKDCHISDYHELQRLVDSRYLIFKGDGDDKDITVSLTPECIELLEQRHRATVDRVINYAVSIGALIVSIIALYLTYRYDICVTPQP